MPAAGVVCGVEVSSPFFTLAFGSVYPGKRPSIPLAAVLASKSLAFLSAAEIIRPGALTTLDKNPSLFFPPLPSAA